MSNVLKLAGLLTSVQLARKNICLVMSEMKPKEAAEIFANNPVFYDGVIRDPNESHEHFETERYIQVMDLLDKAHRNLVVTEEKLMLLGLGHVRKRSGTQIPQNLEE